MTRIAGLFSQSDKVQMEVLNQRLKRHEVISANIVNAETPGYRAIGYDFEEQLQAIADPENKMLMKTTNPKHFKNAHTLADGTVSSDAYIRPNESVSEDGNTVDVDQEMSELAQNQILYRGTVELINRKLAILRYAIQGGR